MAFWAFLTTFSKKIQHFARNFFGPAGFAGLRKLYYHKTLRGRGPQPGWELLTGKKGAGWLTTPGVRLKKFPG